MPKKVRLVWFKIQFGLRPKFRTSEIQIPFHSDFGVIRISDVRYSALHCIFFSSKNPTLQIFNFALFFQHESNPADFAAGGSVGIADGANSTEKAAELCSACELSPRFVVLQA